MMLERLEGSNEMENDPTTSKDREPSDPVDNNMNIDDDNEGDEGMEGENEDAFDENELDEEEFGPQEFSALNNQLDQLQTALDSLESRNDDIHSKLLDLLRSSREIRQNMTEENHNRKMEEDVEESDEINPTSSSSNLSNVTDKKCILTAETLPTSTVQNCDDSQSIPEQPESN